MNRNEGGLNYDYKFNINEKNLRNQPYQQIEPQTTKSTNQSNKSLNVDYSTPQLDHKNKDKI